VFTGFAAAFLLKILRPKFSFMMREDREQEIVQLVQRLINLLSSEEVAIDDRHTPKLYSRFLADVLAKHKANKTTKESQAPPPASGSNGAIQNGETRNTSTSTSAFAFASGPMDVTPEPPMYALPQLELNQPPLGSMDPASQGWMYDFFGTQSTMDGGAPVGMGMGQAPQDDGMLMSMAAITDPRFWEQGTMPGFSWATGEQMAVDEPARSSCTPPHTNFY